MSFEARRKRPTRSQLFLLDLKERKLVQVMTESNSQKQNLWICTTNSFLQSNQLSHLTMLTNQQTHKMNYPIGVFLHLGNSNLI